MNAEAENDILARIMFHEFLLEVNHAQFFADLPDGEIHLQDFADSILRLIRNGKYPQSVIKDAEFFDSMKRMEKVAIRYFEKVAMRRADIKRQLEQQGAAPPRTHEEE